MSETQAAFDVRQIVPCEDCGEKHPFCELHDTIAGFLCDECEARFTGACAGLVRACVDYAKGEGGNQWLRL